MNLRIGASALCEDAFTLCLPLLAAVALPGRWFLRAFDVAAQVVERPAGA
jgi:hypothetical protein